MGGRPSKQTPADGRLKDNQPSPPKQAAKSSKTAAAPPKATPPKGKTSK